MAEEEEGLGSALIAELYRPPALLPIAQLKDALLYAIETFPVTVIVSRKGIYWSMFQQPLISNICVGG
jgi:ATP-dependent RNA helicase DDX35